MDPPSYVETQELNELSEACTVVPLMQPPGCRSKGENDTAHQAMATRGMRTL